MPALNRYILYIITSGIRVAALLLLAGGVTPLQAQLAPLDRTLDSALDRPLDRVRDRRSPIDDRVDEELGDAVDDAVAEPAEALDDAATEQTVDGAVDAGTDAAAATAGDALEQGTAAAAAAVDYNHLYRGVSGAAPEAAQPDRRAQPDIGEAAALRIGIIDSGVAPDHPSLSGTRVTTRDFARHKGTRQMGHGTAVASVIAGAVRGWTALVPAMLR